MLTLIFLLPNLCQMQLSAQAKQGYVPDTNRVYRLQIESQLKQSDKLINQDIRNALLLSKESLKKAIDINDTYLIAEAKLSIGKCYEFLGVNEEALSHLSEALATFTQLKVEKKRALTLRQIGYIYYYSDEYFQSLKYFNEVNGIGKQLNDTSLIIAAIIGQGQVYGNTNRLDSAGMYFREAMLLSKKAGDLATEVQSLFYIGDVHLFSGRVYKALEIFHQIEKDFDLEKINSKLVSSLYNSITYAYIKVGNLPMAKKYNQLTYLSLKEFPRQTIQILYYHNKFRIDSISKDYFAAIRSFQDYKALSDSLHQKSFAERRTNFEIAFELERKDAEIERLKLDNQIKDLKIRQNQIIRYGTFVLVALFAAIIVQSFRHIRKTKRNNLKLQNQKEELQAANEEISAKSYDLNEKNTELEILLDELKNTQYQLIQSEKMASLGILAAGVAHEINNPLNFIQGGILCIDQYANENLQDHLTGLSPLLNGIQEGVTRAAAIVSSLNQYTHQNSQVDQNCSVHEILDNCLLFLHNQTKDRIRITKNYTTDNHSLIANQGRLHQAFLNILTNAVQAIESTGKLSITTWQENNSFKVAIEDSGIGISPEHLNKMFTPFFTTKQPGKGTGLGLAITYSIIKEHNGSIAIESEPNKGTKVFLSFPFNH
jgi:signal transduction histidine kinase